MGSNTLGFLKTRSGYKTITIPGAKYIDANGINSAGDVAGDYFDTQLYHGFVLSEDGKLTSFDCPGATGTYIYGINDAGDVVGSCSTSGSRYGFVLSRGVFKTIAITGAPITAATGINSEGEIAGFSHSALMYTASC
jgi:uncharacterized membrane protein